MAVLKPPYTIEEIVFLMENMGKHNLALVELPGVKLARPIPAAVSATAIAAAQPAITTQQAFEATAAARDAAMSNRVQQAAMQKQHAEERKVSAGSYIGPNAPKLVQDLYKSVRATRAPTNTPPNSGNNTPSGEGG